MSHCYLLQILSELNRLTIVTSKKILVMSIYVLILIILSHKENQELAVYNFRHSSYFSIPNVNSVYHGLESLSISDQESGT